MDNARRGSLQLRQVLWTRSEINLQTKIRLIGAAVLPSLAVAILRYQRMEVIDYWCLRGKNGKREPLATKLNSCTSSSNDDDCNGSVKFYSAQTDNALDKRCLLQTVWNGAVTLTASWKSGSVPLKGTWSHLGLKSVYGHLYWKQNWVATLTNLASSREDSRWPWSRLILQQETGVQKQKRFVIGLWFFSTWELVGERVSAYSLIKMG